MKRNHPSPGLELRRSSKLSICMIALGALLLGVPPASAQETEGSAGEEIDRRGGDTDAEETSGQEIVPPELVESVEATYPPEAFEQEVEADVLLQIDIAEDGSVGEITPQEVVYYWYDEEGVLQQESVSPEEDDWGFVQPAVEAVRQYRFEPAQLIDAENPEGTAIPVRLTWRVGFVIDYEEQVVSADEGGEQGAGPDGANADAEASDGPQAEDAPINFSGEVLERGTRRALAGVVVMAELPANNASESGVANDVESAEESDDRGGDSADDYAAYAEAVTNSEGRFSFRGLQAGNWEIVIDETGYRRFETDEEIVPRERTDVVYYVERERYGEIVTRTTAEAPRKEVTRRVIEVVEIQRIPGNNNDALKVVQNLPGVARASFGGGDVIVRGSEPGDSIFLIDGMPLPILYHFGGLRAVVPTELLSDITFIPGAFSAQYGRATGGAVTVDTRESVEEGVHGHVDVNVFDTGVFLTTSIAERWSLWVGGRRSYIDAILLPVADQLELNFTTAPRYWDYQTKLRYDHSPDTSASILVYGSDDAIDLVLEDESDLEPDQRGGVSASIAFHSVLARFDTRLSDSLTLETRAQYSRQVFDFDRGRDLFFELGVDNVAARATLAWEQSEHLTLRGGFDGDFNFGDIRIRLPRPPKEGDPPTNFDSLELQEREVDNFTVHTPGLFLEAEIQPFEQLQIVPGVRSEYYTSVDEPALDGRLSLRYTVAEDWVLKAATGTFHRSPDPDETDEVFGNSELGLETAFHYVAGFEWSILDYLNLNIEGFYKDLRDLVSRSDRIVERDGEPTEEVYNNEGRGRVYGLELLLRHELANNLFGWVAYTLSRSERKDFGEEEWRVFDFDQTHIFTALLSYELPRNWAIGARWRYVTANPFVPLVGGVYDSDSNEFLPVPASDTERERLEPFHQLDVRVDKRWIFERWTLNTYLDLQNAYNRMNEEARAYNYDFSESDSITGLPIIPSFGIRGEF